MIRSDSNKFIFLRVPKNASSSLAQWFIKNYTDEYDVYTEVNDGGISSKGDARKLHSKYSKDSHFIHMTLQELKDEGIVHMGHLKDYETISVIRNPLERQLSLHFFLASLHRYKPEPGKFREHFWEGHHIDDTNNKILQSDYTIVDGVDYGTWWGYDNLDYHVTKFEETHGVAKFPLGKLKMGITNHSLLDEFYDDASLLQVRWRG